MIESYRGSMEAIILAGGYGQRMGTATSDTQKCLLPIDGQPVIGHILQRLVTAFGSVDVKVGVGYRGEAVRDWIERNKPNSVTVEYIPHTPGSEYLAYMSMENYIHGDFIATAGDVIVSSNAYTDVINAYYVLKPDLVIAFSPSTNEVLTHAVGKIDTDGNISDFLWPPPIPVEDGYVRDMSLYASNKEGFFNNILKAFPSISEGQERSIQKSLEHGLPIKGLVYPNNWIHLADTNDLEKSASKRGI